MSRPESRSDTPIDAAAALPQKRRGPWRYLLAGAFVLALVWTISRLGPNKILAVVRQSDPTWLLLSFVPLLARFGIWGIKWHRILGRQERVPFGVALRNIGAGSFVNLTTPTAKLGGAVVRSVFMDRRYGWGLAASYGRTLADQLTNSIGSLLLFGIIAVLTALSYPALAERMLLASTGSIALILVVAVIALRPTIWDRLQRPGFREFVERRTPARLRRWASRGAHDDGFLRLLFPVLAEGHAIRTFLPDLILGGAAFGTLALTNAFVLRALGVETDLLLIATVVIIGYFGGSVVGAWGGIGVTEMMLAGLYVRAGIPADTALAAALLHRAGFYLVVILFGGPSLWIEANASTRQKAPTPPCT